MTENEYNEIEKISRDYVDNFSFKQMILDDVMPKYFEEETSNLNIGLTGMVTDMAGQITEDGFNTSSTLLILSLDIFEMWSKPSFPHPTSTKAPNGIIFVTVPS